MFPAKDKLRVIKTSNSDFAVLNSLWKKRGEFLGLIGQMTNASKPILKLRGEVLYSHAFSMTAIADEEAIVILQYYAIRKKIQSPTQGIFRVDNGGQKTG